MEINLDGWGYLEMDRLADTLKAIADAKFHTAQPTLPVRIYRSNSEIDCYVEDSDEDGYKEYNGIMYSVILCDTCGNQFIEPGIEGGGIYCCQQWLDEHNELYGK